MNQVRALRSAAGISQQELALRSGVAQPNIAAYETGRRRPTEQTMQRLRDATRPIPHEALNLHRDALVQLAGRHGLNNLRVFGSAMRGTDGPDSDLDILVTRAPGLGLLGLATFAEQAEALLGVRIDVVTDGGLGPDHQILAEAVAV